MYHMVCLTLGRAGLRRGRAPSHGATPGRPRRSGGHAACASQCGPAAIRTRLCQCPRHVHPPRRRRRVPGPGAAAERPGPVTPTHAAARGSVVDQGRTGPSARRSGCRGGAPHRPDHRHGTGTAAPAQGCVWRCGAGPWASTTAMLMVGGWGGGNRARCRARATCCRTTCRRRAWRRRVCICCVRLRRPCPCASRSPTRLALAAPMPPSASSATRAPKLLAVSLHVQPALRSPRPYAPSVHA
jgi:hypothetical protein